MKLWIMIFSAALFAGGTCLGVALHPALKPAPKLPADGHPGGGWSRHGELSVQRFADSLALTPDQDRELDLILEENQRDLAAYGRAMRSAHDRCRERILKILTPEQQKKLDELRSAERRERDLREVEKSLKTWTSTLGLAPDQVEPVRKILLDGKEKRRAFFADRKPDPDPVKIREHFQGLRGEQTRALEKVLKPEQFRKYVESQESDR